MSTKIETKIQLDIDQLAMIIEHLSPEELEILMMKLDNTDLEIRNRLEEITNNKVNLLNESDIFYTYLKRKI